MAEKLVFSRIRAAIGLDRARVVNTSAAPISRDTLEFFLGLACCERFLAFLGRQIEAANTRLARVQTVKRFAVVPAEFTVEGGELTPTLKLRRKVIAQKYAGLIDGLFHNEC